MAKDVSLSDDRSGPCLKRELMEEVRTPRPTCELVGFASPFAVVVAVCSV